MKDFRKIFFQIILLVLAVAFTLCIRYIIATETSPTGSFGQDKDNTAVTVSQMFSSMTQEGR